MASFRFDNVGSLAFPFAQVRVVCMSDTHSLTSHLKFDIPDGDIFIHAGDFTRCGGEDEVTNFNSWIGEISAYT